MHYVFDVIVLFARGVPIVKHTFAILIGGAAILASCTPSSQSEAPPPEVKKTSSAGLGPSAAPKNLPAFAVNELANGLIPAAPQMGRLSVRNDCIVFTMRDSDATPLWPAGSTIEQHDDALIIRVEGGASYRVPSATTIAGAFVPLSSVNMTKFSKPLPERCPSAIFAVARQ